MKIGIKDMEDGIMKKSLYIAAALLALAACTREMEVNAPVGKMTITARTETSAETKTVVEGETHVYWEPGDEIALFSCDKSGKFTTDITAPSASATFSGTLGDDAWTEGADLWAVYPYSEDAVYSDGTITTVLPSEQVARAGSFGKGMNLAIAHSTTSDLQFYNVGGGACFSVSNKGIKMVTFKSINGERLAGKIQVTFEEGEPLVKRVMEGTDEITVYAPDGEFVPGEFYYAVMLPQELAAGLVVSYKDALRSAGLTVEIPSITRSYYGKLDQSDHWFVFDGDYPTPDRVDLGLSVMWGTFNLGATAPSEYGHYYAWGETVPKTYYDWRTYRWGLGFEHVDLFKYCSDPLYGWEKFTDDRLTLALEDDAANLILGGKWRIPTMEEWNELLENCTRTKAWVDGILGCLFTSNINGESIFMPAAGHMSNSSLDYPGSYGYYWSSDLFESRPNLAYGHIFDGNVLGTWSVDGYPRESGYSIRPVYGDPKPVVPEEPVPEAVDMGLPSGLKWASFNLGASKPEEYGDYYAWGETQTKYDYSWSTYKWCIDNPYYLTKYCTSSSYGYSGFIDDKSVLDPEDDAAHVNLGGKWKMPTSDDWSELRTYCNWTWTTLNGVYGQKVISRMSGYTDMWIFLPAAGVWGETGLSLAGSQGSYWSSLLNINLPYYSADITINANVFTPSTTMRYAGLPVRPVLAE